MKKAQAEKRKRRRTAVYHVEELFRQLNSNPNYSYLSEQDWADVQRRWRVKAINCARDLDERCILAAGQPPAASYDTPLERPYGDSRFLRCALALAAATGKDTDFRCCPTCRHFFLAGYDAKVFCSPKCRSRQPRPPRARQRSRINWAAQEARRDALINKARLTLAERRELNRLEDQIERHSTRAREMSK